MPEHVLAPVRRSFRAMAEAFVPEAESLTQQQWARAEAAVETSLAPRPWALKRQLRLFVRVVEWAAVVRYGLPFTRLDAARRTAFLRWLERAPVLALRRGVWGVRTLAFMAVYGLPEVRRAIGYRGHPDGWEARADHGVGGGEHAGASPTGSGEDR